jgi:hypothetical protein
MVVLMLRTLASGYQGFFATSPKPHLMSILFTEKRTHNAHLYDHGMHSLFGGGESLQRIQVLCDAKIRTHACIPVSSCVLLLSIPGMLAELFDYTCP